MPSELSQEQLRRLARLGAAARLEELRREETAIRRAFPEAGSQPARRRPGRPPKVASMAPASNRRRRRPRMSAAARKAVSVRMRKYWADRRKSKAAGK